MLGFPGEQKIEVIIICLYLHEARVERWVSVLASETVKYLKNTI